MSDTLFFKRFLLPCALPLLFLVLSPVEAGAEASFTKPEINERGEIVIIRRTEESRFDLFVLDPAGGRTESAELALGPGTGMPKLKKDSRGRLWAAWIEEDGALIRFAAGLVGPGVRPALRLETRLHPSLPWDWSFDSTDAVWLIWAEEEGGRQSVCVENTATGRTWTVSSSTEEANSLSILEDAMGGVWAFWTAVTPDREQVFSSRFDGSSWSREQMMTPGSKTPNITPRAAAGQDGQIWLVWSGYNGRGYRILARNWVGAKWTPVRAVTSEAEANDVFPWVDLAFGALPVVSWVRYTARGRSEHIRCGEAGAWYEENELSPAPGRPPFVPLAVSGDRAFLVRPDGDSFRGECAPLPFLTGKPRGQFRPPSSFDGPQISLPDLIYNPSLKENVYIAFGDSITYGVCDEDGYDDPGDYIPDKAYPPRLAALLSQSFGPHQVMNEGVPGESTLQGLARLDSRLALHQARYILILEGTNDIIWSDYSLDTTAFNLREMLRRSLEYGLLPALATNIPKYGRNAFPVRLANLNDRIRLLAAERPVPLVDLNKDFSEYPEEDGGPESLYCWGEDRTHPNEKGYQFMAEKWFERIRNFPFPPGGLRGQRAYDEIFFYRAEGNLLEWEDNPKILDPEQIQEYRIYRKKSSDGPSAFRLLSAVAGRRSFFDADIQPDVTYTYVVSTVVSGDLEGPGTQPLNL